MRSTNLVEKRGLFLNVYLKSYININWCPMTTFISI